MTNFTSLNTTSYRIRSKKKSKVKLEYSVYSQSIFVSAQDVGYSYIESNPFGRNELMVGSISAATQEILNHFPRWTKMREDPSSTGFEFVSSFGQNLEELRENLDRMRNEMFIGTAETAQTYKLYKTSNNRIGEIVSSKQRFQIERLRNYSLNSDFSLLAPLRTKKALYWLGNYEVDSSVSVFGSFSAKIYSEGNLYQRLNFRTNSTDSIVFSFFYKTNASQKVLDEKVFSAFIQLVYQDGSREIIREPIECYTNSKWNRVFIRIAPKDKIDSADIQIQLLTNNYLDTVHVDCVQFENSKEPTSWAPRPDDSPWYLNTSQIPKCHATRASSDLSKTSIFMVDDQYKFQYDLPPTRASLIESYTNQEAFSQNIWSRLVDYDKKEWPTKFSFNGDKIYRDNLLIDCERIFEYGIGEIAPDELRMIQYTNVVRNILALTVYKNILYVFCTETFNGETKYYLKALKTKVSKYNKEYLECYGEVEIDILSWINTFSPFYSYPSGSWQIAISSLSNDLLVLKIPSGNILVYKLYFDYGFIDSRDVILYLREDYSSEGMSVIAL